MLFFVWALTSGSSAALGAYVAVRFFPEAGFAQNPTGEYSVALFAFACLIGLALAAAQYVVLRKIFLHHSRSVDAWLLSWIPATVIGVLLLITPLYLFDAADILRAPWLLALIMLPGAVALGIGQWVILRHYEIMEVAWIVRTTIGTLLGACLGLIGAFTFFAFDTFSSPGLMEPVWAGCIGLGLGLFQGELLSEKFTGRGAPNWLIAATVIVLASILPVILTIYFFWASWVH
ncbi:MAG: hypothetical protein EP297_09180 [Gammaproteobacteria bacterium]|nr:MAG: hypothetical protein EP297_09180 [Gammaproteobacteria bacterium]